MSLMQLYGVYFLLFTGDMAENYKHILYLVIGKTTKKYIKLLQHCGGNVVQGFR